MTNRIFYTIVLIALLLCSAGAMRAQTAVKATADRTKILIGEPVQLTLQADIPADQPIRFFRIDSIPHFEFLKKEKIDTSDTGSGTRLVQQLRLTSFDSGHWVIPPIVLYEDVATDSIGIDVSFSPFDTAQPYHDIQDIIDVKPEKKEKFRWWYVVVGVLLLLLIVKWLTRKKKPVVAPVAMRSADPYRIAMERLAALTPEAADAKRYYSELTAIFRIYMHDKKGIHSLQETSGELIAQLRGLGLPAGEFDQLSQVLLLGDFVKFARYVPATEENGASREIIKKSIERIEHIA